ncbi:unnamed protein product [Prorocentrum cordatum]|uniref:Uncharacterized protein n=1 Tax=Prorocentrum cordatum TaxID=2364126 RepID=A0ABN9W9E9_9DINO|nr:unnamed protein product [Polarella glacialis]
MRSMAAAAMPCQPVCAKRRRAGRPKDLPVYVCEYHHEALRCLHHAIRRRWLPFSDLTMVHLDAHPDLAASTTLPAETIFQSPPDVYFEMQKDPGGIAQWILPAVYGGHFSCVWWVRPAWAEQIDDGEYNIAVGRAARSPAAAAAAPDPRARDARAQGPPRQAAALEARLEEEPVETLRISCAAPYFVEDGTYCPEAELRDPKPLRLLVSELPRAGPDRGWEWLSTAASAWTLDVCLADSVTEQGAEQVLDRQDEFASQVADFACGNPFVCGVRPHIAAALSAVQNGASFRQAEVTDVAKFMSDGKAFDAAYNALLRSSMDAEPDPELLRALGELLPGDRRAELLEALGDALAEAGASELQQLLEAGDMVTLPLSRPSSEEELAVPLADFERFLARLIAEPPPRGMGCSPAAVTVARSVVDGFCPMRWLCTLEAGVLGAVRRCVGEVQVIYSDELDLLDRG